MIKKSYPWIKVSFIEKMMVNFFIYGFPPWMKSAGKDDRWSTWTQALSKHLLPMATCNRKISTCARKTFSGKFLMEKSYSKFSVPHVWISNLPLGMKVCKFWMFWFLVQLINFYPKNHLCMVDLAKLSKLDV